MEKPKPKVFDYDIEQLMQLALKEPSNDSNILGVGAMWLAAELYALQEQQAAKQSLDAVDRSQQDKT